MRRRLLTILLFTSCCGVLTASTGCTDPADAIAVGELCVPERDDCPQAVDLVRDDTGRNALDLTLTHHGDDDATAAIRVTTDQQVSLPSGHERPTTDDGGLVLFDDEFPTGSGETIHHSLDAYDLTIATRLHLELQCVDAACDHRLEFVHFADARECIDDEICGRNEHCQEAYGRCAECSTDADCTGEQQSCRQDSGVCHPGDTAGCHSTHATAFDWPLLAIVVLLVLALASRVSRRRLVAMSAVAVVSATTLVATPSVSSADTGASFNAGGGLRILTGEAGELARPGWGISVNQQLRWRRLGAVFEIATNSFGLDPDAYPGGGRLTGYTVGIGPRSFWSLPIDLPTLSDDRPFELVVGLDYTYWNVAENRLAPLTGLDLHYHAVGPTVGINWRWGGLEIGARTGYDHIFGWPGGAISFDVLVGIGP